jgi:hypothetical protein
MSSGVVLLSRPRPPECCALAGTLNSVKVHCGAEYGYDWERMRRTTVTSSRRPQASVNIKSGHKPGCTDKKSA